MRLLRRKSRTFEIQVQDMTLHIQAATDVDEESRAAALSFWELLHTYSIRNPEFRSSKRPVRVPGDAPEIVREIASTAGRAGVGPMFSLQGAVTDHVGRFLARAAVEAISRTISGASPGTLTGRLDERNSGLRIE